MISKINLQFLRYQEKDRDILSILQCISSKKDLRQWAGPLLFTWPLDKVQLFKYLERKRDEEIEIFLYKIINHEQNHIGHIEFEIDHLQKRSVFSRFIVFPKYRGIGLAHRILTKALEVAFINHNLNEVTLSVYKFNIPAIKSYVAIGFNVSSAIEDTDKNGCWDSLIMKIKKKNI